MTSPVIPSHPVLVETLRLAVPLRLAELLALRDVDPDAGHDGEPTRRPIETVEIPGVSR